MPGLFNRRLGQGVAPTCDCRRVVERGIHSASTLDEIRVVGDSPSFGLAEVEAE